MERLKHRREVIRPDRRMRAFVRPHESGEFVQITFEDLYRTVARIRLHKAVPEDVRSYFATVKNLCLYGWFVYSFFAVSVLLSYTAIEMALRTRLRPPKAGRVLGLKGLLRLAIGQGLIDDAGFTSIQHQRKRLRSLKAHDPSVLQQPSSYALILLETIPDLRNAYAHPSMQTIVPPGNAVASLVRAAELINQLFDR